VKLAVQRRTLELSEPFSAAWGTLRERELLLVELTDDEGARGYGEAAPLPGYEGPGSEEVRAALALYAAVIDAHADGPGSAGPMLDACRVQADVPAALAAVEMALWDLAGRRRGVPVAALLTDDPVPAVAVNATLTAADRAGVAEQAAAAAREGFHCVKLKVGIGDDGGRVAAARAAGGPALALRLDANGAWDVDGAVASIEALAAAGLELVEEPVHGVAALRAVRERVSVRVAMDETAAEPGALAAGAADAVCLKVSRCGGISGLLAAAALVRAGGAEPYVASTLDGPLGVAAGLHAAAALASRGPVPPCGLATLGLFEGIGDPLPVRAGSIALPATGGLGIDPV
jgi:L-alanine-DL-glutamate epimerase-like enolase superfamily enzyme